MTASGIPRRARQALSYRNYRLFLSGALVSNSGVWVQMIALAFVIEKLTDSATWVGLAAMMQTLPAVFLGMVGGALADRFPRRIMLMLTNSAQALIALGFAAMWAWGVDRPLAYIALGVVNGCVNGIQLPAWQAFVSELVPRGALLNAVTLNSAQFNASRAVGPMIGGVVLAIGGPGWCFFTNSLTYVPAVLAMIFIQVPRLAPADGDRPSVFRDAAAAVRYTADSPGIRLSILIAGVIAFFGQPVIHLVVIFANDVFMVGETQYGFLADLIGPRIAVGGAGILLAATALWGVIGGRTKVLNLS